MNWSTSCVSFVRVLTILGWLQYFEIFKIDYLVTSNVRFGTDSINPVNGYFLNTCCLVTVAMPMPIGLISNKMAGVNIRDKQFLHCNKERNNTRLRLALFYSFLFTMLALIILNTTAYRPTKYAHRALTLGCHCNTLCSHFGIKSLLKVLL